MVVVIPSPGLIRLYTKTASWALQEHYRIIMKARISLRVQRQAWWTPNGCRRLESLPPRAFKFLCISIYRRLLVVNLDGYGCIPNIGVYRVNPTWRLPASQFRVADSRTASSFTSQWATSSPKNLHAYFRQLQMETRLSFGSQPDGFWTENLSEILSPIGFTILNWVGWRSFGWRSFWEMKNACHDCYTCYICLSAYV